MQPNSYKKGMQKRDWFISEKLDGMKGRWIDGNFITRSGNKIDAPKWFLKLLPNFDVEGELYFGKGTFHKTGSLKSRSVSETSWYKVVFYLFDVVDFRLTWIERQHKLKKIETSDHLQIVKWKKVKNRDDIEEEFAKIIKEFGEGIIIANPWGLYVNGYSDDILKYKVLNDSEAVIIGYNKEENGRLISFIVNPVKGKKINEKITFKIGTGLKVKDRYDYEKKYPLGTILTYSYNIIGKNGKPRTPVLKGIRIDS